MKEGKEKKKGNYIICGVPHMHTGFEVCVCVGGGGGYAALRVTALEMMSFIDEQRG